MHASSVRTAQLRTGPGLVLSRALASRRQPTLHMLLLMGVSLGFRSSLGDSREGADRVFRCEFLGLELECM